ncbi:hypothetical protein [Chitinophaga sp. Cy-1792]|uniref:hypothetical protein n=1 Tax=Chitinophaga sp. Cy-1792 TaxID=2608339 RepID=UPI00141F4751|nr:hypothetical protein [Chitinophaga sp. Cy-1792]NIG54455.1 hypothetical protein [Chitinophaga sp. Cy-1792]
MKNRIFSGWSIMRWIRLAIGIAIIVQGIIAQDRQFVLIGGLLSLLPILNFGCAGGSCGVPPRRVRKEREVRYGEVS